MGNLKTEPGLFFRLVQNMQLQFQVVQPDFILMWLGEQMALIWR